ncbi:Lar family restriction alleviation protein [Neptuniibacter sp. QD37_11]|uniref:Lar family restriction alleviation protein n=1 Tax=Neptuniibacter sp. QD37_11 TaxID=3398209 RepID=UPI0039F6490E
MTEEQEEAVRLFKQAMDKVRESGLTTTCSVDVSTGEDDADARCFGTFTEINNLPSDTGFGSRDIELIFHGSLNFKLTGEGTVNKDGLLPCPFCGEVPELPDGDNSQYEIECDCGMALSTVQIKDLMTIEERMSDKFTDCRHGEEFIERAKHEAIRNWNTRAR